MAYGSKESRAEAAGSASGPLLPMCGAQGVRIMVRLDPRDGSGLKDVGYVEQCHSYHVDRGPKYYGAMRYMPCWKINKTGVLQSAPPGITQDLLRDCALNKDYFISIQDGKFVRSSTIGSRLKPVLDEMAGAFLEKSAGADLDDKPFDLF